MLFSKENKFYFFATICYNIFKEKNMLLTKKFIFKTSTTEAIILGHLTYSASKLFNEANYQRHEYKKLGLEKRPNWYDQKKNMKTNMWYKNLPSQTAQDVLKTLDESWKSYDVLKYKYDHGKKLSGEPKAPYYKKKDSHTNISYLNNGFKLLDNKIRFAIPKAMKEHLYNKFKIDSQYFYVPIKEQIDGEIKEIAFSYVKKFEYEVYIFYHNVKMSELTSQVQEFLDRKDLNGAVEMLQNQPRKQSGASILLALLNNVRFGEARMEKAAETEAMERILAMGLRPRSFACSSLISKSADAPSLRPEALPAVTVPPSLKAGFNFASPSSVVVSLKISKKQENSIEVGLCLDVHCGQHSAVNVVQCAQAC